MAEVTPRPTTWQIPVEATKQDDARPNRVAPAPPEARRRSNGRGTSNSATQSRTEISGISEGDYIVVVIPQLPYHYDTDGAAKDIRALRVAVSPRGEAIRYRPLG